MTGRILMLERKFDDLLREIKAQKSEEEQDKVFQMELKERVRNLEESEKRLVSENVRLKEELNSYKKRLEDSINKVDKEKNDFKELVCEESEKFKRDLEIRKAQWNETKNTEIVEMKEVIQEQMREDKEIMAKKMVDVMKKKETLIREIAEKKRSVIIFGMKEQNITYKPRRDKEELKTVRDLLKNLNDTERRELEEEVEEIHRLGPFKAGESRPIKVLVKSQKATEEILYRTSKLKEIEGCEKVYIRKNRNEEERKIHSNLLEEAKHKNDERNEEEKKKFFWRVMGERVRKWYLEKRDMEKSQEGAVGGKI